MIYLNVNETAAKWNVSERSVRNYCSQGRVPGSVLRDSAWIIPYSAEKPERKKRTGKLPDELLPRLRAEKESGLTGGIYHKVQVDMTYNSNHIEGSRLTHDQTRFIFETNTIGFENIPLNVDDIIETANHFRCIDLVIDMAAYKPSESFIKQLHFLLKTGTSDSRKPWFAVGEYKRFENEVGGNITTMPEDVSEEMKSLLKEYNKTKEKTLEEIIAFHYEFERIHPFQDGNGRIGRLILFKECLRNGITPFIIDEHIKLFYYRGLKSWKDEPGYLLDTCHSAQDTFKAYLDLFKIKYTD